MQTRYYYAGEPAELVRISPGINTVVYLIQVANGLVSTCLMDRRFRIEKPSYKPRPDFRPAHLRRA